MRQTGTRPRGPVHVTTEERRFVIGRSVKHAPIGSGASDEIQSFARLLLSVSIYWVPLFSFETGKFSVLMPTGQLENHASRFS